MPHSTAAVVSPWWNNYIPLFYADVIVYSCPNPDNVLANLCSDLPAIFQIQHKMDCDERHSIKFRSLEISVKMDDCTSAFCGCDYSVMSWTQYLFSYAASVKEASVGGVSGLPDNLSVYLDYLPDCLLSEKMQALSTSLDLSTAKPIDFMWTFC